MTTPRVAIVMTLHDEACPEAITALAGQTADPDDMEVVIVDGHRDPRIWEVTARAVRDGRDRTPVRAVAIDRAGRGACWNRGVAETTAPLVLFLADDFVASPTLVAEHLRFHEERPEEGAIGVGPAYFPEALRRSWFRRWIEDSGRLFGVSFTQRDPELSRGFFYGGNTSMKRSLFERAGGFDDRFPHHAVEDYELGLRLRRLGAEPTFLPTARAEHLHRFSLWGRVQSVREAGAALRLVERLHPDLAWGWRPIVEQPLWRHARSVAMRRAASALMPTRGLRARTYRAVLDRALARGFRLGADGTPPV